MMLEYGECEGDGECGAQPDAECLGCILAMSDLEMKTFARFLEEHSAEMHAAGLSLWTIEHLINAVTV
jgi:hypothetical protein